MFDVFDGWLRLFAVGCVGWRWLFVYLLRLRSVCDVYWFDLAWMISWLFWFGMLVLCCFGVLVGLGGLLVWLWFVFCVNSVCVWLLLRLIVCCLPWLWLLTCDCLLCCFGFAVELGFLLCYWLLWCWFIVVLLFMFVGDLVWVSVVLRLVVVALRLLLFWFALGCLLFSVALRCEIGACEGYCVVWY